MSKEVKFDLLGIDPDGALESLAAADRQQEYNLSASNNQIRVTSQLNRSEDEIRAFVDSVLSCTAVHASTDDIE